MSDTDVELGPVDYLVVAFPAGKTDFSGEMAAELRALIRSNTIRVLDLVVLTKDADGSVEANELPAPQRAGESPARRSVRSCALGCPSPGWS